MNPNLRIYKALNKKRRENLQTDEKIWEFISNIKDSDSYANLRISCKSFYYLMTEVKRYYNNKNVKELFIFSDLMLNGFHIKWYIRFTSYKSTDHSTCSMVVMTYKSIIEFNWIIF